LVFNHLIREIREISVFKKPSAQPINEVVFVVEPLLVLSEKHRSQKKWRGNFVSRVKSSTFAAAF